MPPDIENPKTFGDFYWKSEVEAKRLRSEQYEKSYGPVITSFLHDTGLFEFIPEPFRELFGHLEAPTEPDWDDVQRMFLGTVARGVGLVAGEQMAKPFEYEANEKFLNTRIDANMAMTLHRRKKVTDNYYLHRMASAGYSEDESRHAYTASFPYPTLPEIIRYGRYHSDADNPKMFVWELFDIHPDDWEMWNWLSFQKLNTEQVQTVYRRGGWDRARATTELARLGWPLEERDALINLAYQLPNAMLLVQGNLMQGVSTSDMISDIAKAGIHPAYADKYFDGVLTKPNTADIVNWQLRLDPSLGGLNNELSKIGIHPAYFDTYKTLAFPIPAVPDLITMAVREAFTPEIAGRFGQYEGLPKQFVEFAAQKGISQEWAERFWAAHWTLPSPEQGFRMLQRGIIGEGDLQLLMRALDIMPFWRDKLIQLAYKPLTRVDVRRMHLLGTLGDGDVKRAYTDLGYNEYNALKMADFTIRYNRRSLSGFTPRDALSAYINRYIQAGQAAGILRDIGVKSSEVDNAIRLAGLKRDWKYKDEQIAAIGNRYRKGTRDLTQTRSALSQLGLAADHVSTLLGQWEPSAEAERVATFTKADTLKLMTMGLIDEPRARKELQLLGYDKEREDLLIKLVTSQKG
jgi:hypothetical protein